MCIMAANADFMCIMISCVAHPSHVLPCALPYSLTYSVCARPCRNSSALSKPLDDCSSAAAPPVRVRCAFRSSKISAPSHPHEVRSNHLVEGTPKPALPLGILPSHPLGLRIWTPGRCCQAPYGLCATSSLLQRARHRSNPRQHDDHGQAEKCISAAVGRTCLVALVVPCG